jgi:hypothetical protein
VLVKPLVKSLLPPESLNVIVKESARTLPGKKTPHNITNSVSNEKRILLFIWLLFLDYLRLPVR